MKKEDNLKFYLRFNGTVYSAEKFWELALLLPKDEVVKKHLKSEVEKTEKLKGYQPKPMEIRLPVEVFEAVKEGIKEQSPKFNIGKEINLTSITNEVTIIKYTF